MEVRSAVLLFRRRQREGGRRMPYGRRSAAPSPHMAPGVEAVAAVPSPDLRRRAPAAAAAVAAGRRRQQQQWRRQDPRWRPMSASNCRLGMVLLRLRGPTLCRRRLPHCRRLARCLPTSVHRVFQAVPGRPLLISRRSVSRMVHPHITFSWDSRKGTAGRAVPLGP